MPEAVGEAAEREMDMLMERRHDPGDGAEMQDPGYIESVRRFNSRRREEQREAWRGWHLEQAERIERAAAGLVEEHRKIAEELLGSTATNPGEGGR